MKAVAAKQQAYNERISEIKRKSIKKVPKKSSPLLTIVVIGAY